MNDRITSFIEKGLIKLNDGLLDKKLSEAESNFLKSLIVEFKKVIDNNDPNEELMDAINAIDSDFGVDWYFNFLSEIGYNENIHDKLYGVIESIRGDVKSINWQNKEEYSFEKFSKKVEEGENFSPYFRFYYNFFHPCGDDLNSNLGKRYVQVLQNNSSNFRKVLGKYLIDTLNNVPFFDNLNLEDLSIYIRNTDRDWREIANERYRGNYEKMRSSLLESAREGNSKDILDITIKVKRQSLEEVLNGIKIVANIAGVQLSDQFEKRVLNKYDRVVRDKQIDFYKGKLENALNELEVNERYVYGELILFEIFDNINRVCGDDSNLARSYLSSMIEETWDKLVDDCERDIQEKLCDILSSIYKKNGDILREIADKNDSNYFAKLKNDVSNLSQSKGNEYVEILSNLVLTTKEDLFDCGWNLIRDFENGLFIKHFGERVSNELGSIQNRYISFKGRLEDISRLKIDVYNSKLFIKT